MSVRSLVLGVVLVFIVALGGLTLAEALKGGVDILVVASLVVLVLFTFGIVGALLHPPEE
jgi:hypothetical protein